MGSDEYYELREGQNEIKKLEELNSILSINSQLTNLQIEFYTRKRTDLGIISSSLANLEKAYNFLGTTNVEFDYDAPNYREMWGNIGQGLSKLRTDVNKAIEEEIANGSNKPLPEGENPNGLGL